MNEHTSSKTSGTSFTGNLLNASFWFLILLYLETALHFILFESISAEYLFTVGFSAVLALILSSITSPLPIKVNKGITIGIVSVLCILYCSQVVYSAIFGSMYSVSLMALGGDAFTSFWRESLLTILENLLPLFVLLLPIPATALLAAKCSALFTVRRDFMFLIPILSAVVLHFALVSCLGLGGKQDYSTYYYYHSSDATTNQCAERFGLITTMRLELFASGSDDDWSSEDQENNLPQFEFIPVSPSDAENAEDSATSSSDSETEKEEPSYNVIDLDFSYFNSLTNDTELQYFNSYISSLAPSNKNEYTGKLADYNLITICAESFDTGAIREDLTPTLYKLANEGFIFDNYYNSYPNITTEGEYSFCLGLLPDISRSREVSSFYVSQRNSLPFALGNVFREQAGVTSYAYHNYDGNYYNRALTHPNMGYKCKFAGNGMTFTTSWPSSDLEMMEQSVSDYIKSDQQFHAYYMTFSGHFKYARNINPMVARNYDTVDALELDISEASKCYLSCNYELEKALTYLMNELEKAGVADRTAIVLAGDHFPYGLQDEEYAELVDHDVSGLNKYKSTLIFWVGGMEEPVHVDDYMCNIDILPTILNLWGFNYDSRLLIGTDIFSDSEHIAVLRDKSFLTEKVWFNTSTGKAEWKNGEDTADEEYLESTKNKVKNMFSAGITILGKAYYDYIFDTCGVTYGNDQP